MIFLITSCAHPPLQPKAFDAQFKLVTMPEGERRACLSIDKVKELRLILIRAGYNQGDE